MHKVEKENTTYTLLSIIKKTQPKVSKLDDQVLFVVREKTLRLPVRRLLHVLNMNDVLKIK